MPEIIFATNNPHKVEEIRSVIGSLCTVISLQDAGINIDIPEPFATLEQNAQAKTNTIYSLTGKDCFGEDTGLEVEALNGEPGVKSARYAGEDKNPDDNIKKLLSNLTGSDNRHARFRTVISLQFGTSNYLFEGICDGTIITEPRGTMGFGYDFVFVPKGAEKTFAEMNLEEKNKYSHRKKATVSFLRQIIPLWEKSVS